uniref:Beta-1,3-galactosyl-O-glycosyl-glycoprotein beta-1,6-N-acetylglucosaminyltransferase-like n=1 Tax=Gouania willdenowi TaxID=441366 RepID=A0A8C5DEA4_GOUWI
MVARSGRATVQPFYRETKRQCVRPKYSPSLRSFVRASRSLMTFTPVRPKTAGTVCLRIKNTHYLRVSGLIEACIYRRFKLKRKYLTMPLSKEEEDFPLAFSIIVHHKVQNFERLLRAIYAPHNIYCIHVDQKSPVSVVSAIKAITSCFSNVFLAKRTENVTYASWSRVQADLNCMGELYNSSIKWKYFINLCGQDFPLKTNLEIVRMLRSFKGKNSLESEKMSEGKKGRVNNNTGKKKEKPPFDLPILSGSAYIVVNRGYIRSVLEDSRIQTLIEWAKDTYSPDEFLWATIQRMPGIPGSRWPHLPLQYGVFVRFFASSSVLPV